MLVCILKVGDTVKYKEIYDEYSSLLQTRGECLNTLSTLKDGYISNKTISGNKYFYLQKKVDGKLGSEYIKEDMLPQVRYELEKRVELEQAITQAEKRLDLLETAAKLLDKTLCRKLIIMRRCADMDSMPVDARRKSLEFGNAMTALEGIPASEDTETALSLWAVGQYSFREGYMKALAKYRLIEV